MVKAPPLGKFDFPAFLLNLVDFLLQLSRGGGEGGRAPLPLNKDTDFPQGHKKLLHKRGWA